eukprot:COSAG02_NODE_1818_length_10774_cov_4.788009_4_plen_74_part_00
MAGNIPESPVGIYIYPGGLEGVRVRINRFIPVPIVVRIWHLTVVPVPVPVSVQLYLYFRITHATPGGSMDSQY